jgi:phosphatidylserine decarboxylase
LKTALLVSKGQTAIGGETIIADFGRKKTAEFKFERK